MWDTVGRVWRVRRVDVKDEGGVEGLSARRRSGLSSMRRVFRGGVEGDVRDETAVEIVLVRCARESEVSVWCPGVSLLVLVDSADVVVMVGSRCATGAAAAGDLEGSIRPGGALTGRDCNDLAGGMLGACCGFCAGLAATESRHNPPKPSTNAKRRSRLSFSRSNPALFLASCLQNSYSLIQLTSTTL